jgi:retinol dehydrogenase-14
MERAAHPIILVTGATGGIGRQTAAELASSGARVLLHGRDPERTRAAAVEVSNASGGSVLPVVADFTSLSAVRNLVEQVAAVVPRLDVLVNNAATYSHTREVTADGFELTFQVNHLAPFLLTNLLVPLLRESTPARVVTVSSSAHYRAVLDFDDLGSARAYNGYEAYALSKLANVLFAYELAERLAGEVTSNAVHPGTVDTNLLRLGFPGMQGSSVEQGAATSVYLAISPDVAGVTGEYFEDLEPAPSSELTHDRALRVRLWRMSAEMVGLNGAGA